MSALEIEHVISQITTDQVHANPSTYIRDLNPLLNTTEGRRLLLNQRGEKALALIYLFDWVATSICFLALPVKTEGVIFRL